MWKCQWKHRSQGPKASAQNSWRVKAKRRDSEIMPERIAPPLLSTIAELASTNTKGHPLGWPSDNAAGISPAIPAAPLKDILTP
jgi:hypothetical protein